MTRKSPCTPLEINYFIRTDLKEEMDQMIYILNNSLEGLPFNPSEPSKKMQKSNDLLAQCFINDFHWKLQQDRGRQNNTGNGDSRIREIDGIDGWKLIQLSNKALGFLKKS